MSIFCDLFEFRTDDDGLFERVQYALQEKISVFPTYASESGGRNLKEEDVYIGRRCGKRVISAVTHDIFCPEDSLAAKVSEMDAFLLDLLKEAGAAAADVSYSADRLEGKESARTVYEYRNGWLIIKKLFFEEGADDFCEACGTEFDYYPFEPESWDVFSPGKSYVCTGCGRHMSFACHGSICEFLIQNREFVRTSAFEFRNTVDN